MITELSAAMTAIKETISLAKVISDGKTDSEVTAAVIELRSKLLTLQMECLSLGDTIRSRNEEIMHLKATIASYEDFKHQTDGYFLNQLDSGSFVYSKEKVVGGAKTVVHLCANCFSKHVASILQPIPSQNNHMFHRSRCLNCESVFFMNYNDKYEPSPGLAEIGHQLCGSD
ncbi:hypothetical protein [Plesiomonas shigelloides]|uniref:hypothetical protein n=1 Tax=Plesiomonas shigelloides TaxID=703 RepID=UPI0008FFF086|nr:hypothetical protein [Plesiomonas shigelloides]